MFICHQLRKLRVYGPCTRIDLSVITRRDLTAAGHALILLPLCLLTAQA